MCGALRRDQLATLGLVWHGSNVKFSFWSWQAVHTCTVMGKGVGVGSIALIHLALFVRMVGPLRCRLLKPLHVCLCAHTMLWTLGFLLTCWTCFYHTLTFFFFKLWKREMLVLSRLLLVLKDVKEGGLAEWKGSQGLCMLCCCLTAVWQDDLLSQCWDPPLLWNYTVIQYPHLHSEHSNNPFPATSVPFPFLCQPSLSFSWAVKSRREMWTTNLCLLFVFSHCVGNVSSLHVFNCASGDEKANRQAKDQTEINVYKGPQHCSKSSQSFHTSSKATVTFYHTPFFALTQSHVQLWKFFYCIERKLLCVYIIKADKRICVNEESEPV